MSNDAISTAGSLIIKPGIYSHRPQPCSVPASAAFDMLEGNGIHYKRISHSPAKTAQQCAEAKSLLGAEVYKNLFLTTATRNKYFLLIMPGDKPFRTAVFSKLVKSSRLSFAREDEMVGILGTQPGSLSVLSLIFDESRRVELAIDKDILRNENFGCHPCDNTHTVCFSTMALTDILLPGMQRSPIYVELPDAF